MSQLSGAESLDLSNGLSWHAAIELPERPADEERVLWEQGPLLGGPRFTVLTVGGSSVMLEVTTDDGIVHRTKPVPMPLNEGHHAELYVFPVGPGKWELGVRIDNVEKTRTTFEGALSKADPAITAMGSDVLGQRPAAF